MKKTIKIDKKIVNKIKRSLEDIKQGRVTDEKNNKWTHGGL